MTNTPVRALVIQPDATYRAQTLAQDIRTLQEIVGGYVQAVTTTHATLLMNEEGKIHGLPINQMATYLWWKLQPEMEAHDSLSGTVIVTGLADSDGDITEVPQAVLDLYEKMDALRLCDESPDPATSEAPFL